MRSKIIVLVLGVLFSGCASLQHRADYVNKDGRLAGSLAIDRVEVLVDHAVDGDLAWQVAEYAGVQARKNLFLESPKNMPVFSVA
ncbi:MAG: hypothetical protein LBS64_00475, partial [Spirochaetaceae bacterium]|nr:hypothetical protein [Spirochaetaceae bacterium]